MKRLFVLGGCVVAVVMLAKGAAQSESTFVGSKACGECHQAQLENYAKYAKKAKSATSVLKMSGKLTAQELNECYACHTTGYGKPGGFVSFEKTPDLANAGCEVCHGPGAEHVASGGDPKLIKKRVAVAECLGCHNEERVKSFGFKPLVHAGAH